MQTPGSLGSAQDHTSRRTNAKVYPDVSCNTPPLRVRWHLLPLSGPLRCRLHLHTSRTWPFLCRPYALGLALRLAKRFTCQRPGTPELCIQLLLLASSPLRGWVRESALLVSKSSLRKARSKDVLAACKTPN